MTAPLMHVACIAEGAYWPHAGAMVHSLLSQHERGTIVLHVLHGPREAEANRQCMRELCARFGTTVHLLEVPAVLAARFPDVWFPRSVWYRVLLPELLPDSDRVLYLDADLLVLEPLRELWQTHLAGRPLAAVTNPLHRPLRDYPRRVVGVEPAQYLNSGVLLMDLRLLRELRLADAMEGVARAHPEHTCPEQDALSLWLGPRRLPLHPRWNFQTPLFDLAPAEVPYFEADELAQARARPAIVHFSGPFKPWHYLDRYPYAERYRGHARQTPWGFAEIEGHSATNAVLRRMPPNWVWRYFLAYAWLHRHVKPPLRPLARALRRVVRPAR